MQSEQRRQRRKERKRLKREEKRRELLGAPPPIIWPIEVRRMFVPPSRAQMCARSDAEPGPVSEAQMCAPSEPRKCAQDEAPLALPPGGERTFREAVTIARRLLGRRASIEECIELMCRTYLASYPP